MKNFIFIFFVLIVLSCEEAGNLASHLTARTCEEMEGKGLKVTHHSQVPNDYPGLVYICSESVEDLPKNIVLYTGYYKNGKKHGTSTLYSYQGRIERELVYEYGEIISDESFKW